MYPYISFDLDNTLYSYDTQSMKAVEAVITLLHESKGLDEQELWITYAQFIKSIPGPRLFSDGRTSYEYRRERFAEILAKYSIPGDEWVEKCVDTYSTQILDGMVPFSEARDVLKRLSEDRRVIIITDAPQDIQQTILEVLGIDAHVHGLFTPTTQGQIKEDGGLFLQMLEEYKTTPDQILHFGDSLFRDVLGARIAGIRGILVKKQTGLLTDLLKVHEGGKELEEKDVESITDLNQVFQFL